MKMKIDAEIKNKVILQLRNTEKRESFSISSKP